MAKYLTSRAYLAADDGLPGVSTLSASTLARTVARAESAIDAYLDMPLLAGGGFEPHVIGLMSTKFDFGTRKFRLPSPPVPIRNITRVRVHISNSGPSGSGLYANLLPSEVVFNQWQGYCELVALTLTYSMSAVVWELGLNPPILEVDAEVGYFLPYYGDTLYNDSGDNKTFYALRQFWATAYDQAISNQPNALPPVPPIIYVNGAVQASNTYTLQANEGGVVFNAALTPPYTVTADYTAQIPDLVRDACIDQTTYLLQQRLLNTLGMGGLEQLKTQETFARRAKNDDAEEDQLCAKARLKLSSYKAIAIG